jgi:hypothetical protein
LGTDRELSTMLGKRVTSDRPGAGEVLGTPPGAVGASVTDPDVLDAAGGSLDGRRGADDCGSGADDGGEPPSHAATTRVVTARATDSLVVTKTSCTMLELLRMTTSTRRSVVK